MPATVVHLSLVSYGAAENQPQSQTQSDTQRDTNTHTMQSQMNKEVYPILFLTLSLLIHIYYYEI